MVHAVALAAHIQFGGAMYIEGGRERGREIASIKDEYDPCMPPPLSKNEPSSLKFKANKEP